MVDFKEYLPEIGMGSISGIVIWVLLAVVILGAIGALAIFIINKLRYNKKIVVLEDVAGSDDLEPIGKDRATLVKIGRSGMEVLYLKKRKKYVGAYGKRMGKNTYYFAIGPDGYWYNVTLGSLNKGLEKVKINPTNVNMRYQNEGLQQTIKDRYDKVTFWQKYGGLIAFVGLIAITGIMIYLLFDKWIELSSNVTNAVNAAAQVQEETKKIIGALDAIRGTGGTVSG